MFAQSLLANGQLHALQLGKTSNLAATAPQMIFLITFNSFCNLAEIQVYIVRCPNILQTAMHSYPRVCTVSNSTQPQGVF